MNFSLNLEKYLYLPKNLNNLSFEIDFYIKIKNYLFYGIKITN